MIEARVGRMGWCGRTLLVASLAMVGLASVRASQGADYVAQINKGGIVDLPAGVIEISEPLKPPRGAGLVLRGQGPNKTILKVTADMEALFTLEGKISEQGQIGNFHWWEISNLTIDGDGHAADCLRLYVAVLGRMDRVEIKNFKGHAIHARQWWDSMLSDVHFVKCGDATAEKAAVVLDDPILWKKANGELCTPTAANCNNISFIGCRWENCPFTMLQLNDYATKNRFVSCKWHGPLAPLNQEQVEPPAFDHVQLTGAYDNAFEACNFTNCGGSAIVLRKSNDNSFYGCHIGNSREYGIRVEGSRRPDEAGITWSTIGGKNRKGNIGIVDGLLNPSGR